MVDPVNKMLGNNNGYTMWMASVTDHYNEPVILDSQEFTGTPKDFIKSWRKSNFVDKGVWKGTNVYDAGEIVYGFGRTFREAKDRALKTWYSTLHKL